MPESITHTMHFPWVLSSLCLLLIGAVWSWRAKLADQARQRGVIAMAFSTFALLCAVIELSLANTIQLFEPLPKWAQWFIVDALNTTPLLLFAAVAFGLIVFAPKRKVTPNWVAGMLIVTAMTLLAYASNNVIFFVVGWAGSIAPLLTRSFFTISGDKELPALAKGILITSIIALIGGIVALALATSHFELNLSTQYNGKSSLMVCAFGLLMIAVVLRKGLLPAHSWMLSAYERGPLLPLNLFVNGHLGAFMIARIVIPMMPDVANASLPMLGDFGLITAAYTSLLAIVEKQPRRLLALLSISQASFILTGLESTNPDAIAGALVLWQVVVIATTMMAAVYTSLEARIGTALETTGFLGLAIKAPRLAVFFIAGGLALVGLPLTLGFCAEDLLLHGTLETHPQFGIVLPIVTALNAFHVLRLFARLFLGQPVAAARTMTDALPRERWALTMALLFLLLGGLRPNLLVKAPSAAAERIIAQFNHSHQTAEK